MRLRQKKKDFKRELLAGLLATMRSDPIISSITDLRQIEAALKRTELYCQAVAVEPFGLKVAISAVAQIIRREFRKQVRMAKKARRAERKKTRAKIRRLSAPVSQPKRKKRPRKKAKISKPGKMRREVFPYVVISENFFPFYEQIWKPAIAGREHYLPLQRETKRFSVYVGRYEGGGIQGSHFVGGQFFGGMIIEVTARFYKYGKKGRRRRSRFTWKISRSHRNDGTVANWNDSRIMLANKLPIELQYKLREVTKGTEVKVFEKIGIEAFKAA